jgi:hypothetical protein
MSGSQIIRTGPGGRTSRERKITDPEVRGKKAIGGGRFAPRKRYKDRKDIGVPRPTSTRLQQPTQERGSADVKARAAAAVKKEREEAAKKRAADRSGGEKSKAKPKDLSQQASKILSTKTKAPKPAPGYTPPKVSGLSNKEQKATVKKGERALRDIVIASVNAKRKKEGKPPITSEKELKNRYTSK